MNASDHFATSETMPPVRAHQTDLSDAETRVLGCLIEKQRTTPDQYPLTLNALRLACNQSTNRDPVVEYDDASLREALHKLERRGLVRLASGRGSRAPKYRHLLADALPMSDDEQALMCVLMLRGAQTPGELKQRTERMHPFAGLAAVAQTLDRLITRGLAQRLERRPGQKEERFRQLLTGAGTTAEPADTEPAGVSAPELLPDNGSAAQVGAPPTVAPQVSLEAFEELRARVERVERELEALLGERTDERADASMSPEEPTAWEVN